MSYQDEAAKVGNIPIVFVDLELETCTRDYGTAPCNAALGVTGSDKCYKTLASCQDEAAFDPEAKVYRFCEAGREIPVGIEAIPLIDRVDYASQEITPGKGLGVRGAVTIKLRDAPWPDTEIDPYWMERDYDTTNQGTFCGKLKARQRYFEGRMVRVWEGFVTWPFSWAHFRESAWVVEQVRGPRKGDTWDIVAKDILALADDKKALFPAPSSGVLSADITESTASFTVSPAGIGAQYPASGKVNVGGEGMAYTRSGDTFTITERGASNTAAASHRAGDTVQVVGIFDREQIQDVIYTLLTQSAPIPAEYIDKPAWDAERAANLAGVWSAEIFEPTGVNTLIGELTEQGTCRVWWDPYDQLIQFRAVKPPPEGLPVLTSEEHLQGADVDADGKQRVSAVLVYFAQVTPAKGVDDLANYDLRRLEADPSLSGTLRYGSDQIRKIRSRWFGRTSMGRVTALAKALLAGFQDPPRTLEATLDAAVGLRVGDLFIARTPRIQDVTGAPALVPMEVVYAQPVKGSSHVRYRAQEVSPSIPVGNSYVIEIGDNYPNPDFDNLNLYDAFVNEYGEPEPGIQVLFIILPDVLVSSASTSLPAIVNPDSWPGDVLITLRNAGIASGRGGKGGDGAWWDAGGGAAGEDGEDGGLCLLAEYPLAVDNGAGVLAGGSGGGGGGGVVFDGSFPNAPLVYGGNGGGGAAIGAAGNSPAGIGGASAGGSLTGGAGGDGVYYGGGTYPNNSGGGGGSNAGPGADGETPSTGVSVIQNAGFGGAAGDCINGNSNITWIATGTRYGTIS